MESMKLEPGTASHPGAILAIIPESGRARGRFDAFGALSATVGVGALVFGILNTTDASWNSPVTVTAGSAGVVLLVVFVLIERTAAQPIMPLRLFASRRRTGAYVARFLYLGAEPPGHPLQGGY